MSTWATTSLGLNAASVIAFRFRSALSLSAPPAQKVCVKSDWTRRRSSPAPPAISSGATCAEIWSTLPRDLSNVMVKVPAVPVAAAVMFVFAPTRVKASRRAAVRSVSLMEKGRGRVSW